VVEDDPDIQDAVREVLLASGFTVHPAATGLAGVAAVRLHEPAVVTLDLTLPDIDGFEVARQVRQFSDTYIIMVTARTEELDTLLGLESGADDYLTKPFRPRELRARVEALLRRARDLPATEPVIPAGAAPLAGSLGVGASGAPAEADPVQGPAATARSEMHHRSATMDRAGPFEHNGLRLDPATRTIRIEGSEVDLTRTQFDLLLALLRAGRVVRTKTQLACGVRPGEYDTGAFISEAEERAIEVHIANLRRKLSDDPRRPRWVETVRGVGYRLAPPAQGAASR
jgi:DNA-binding response OmpR family regulator